MYEGPPPEFQLPDVLVVLVVVVLFTVIFSVF